MMGMPTAENHYGEAVSAEKAPEAISTAVASLPPEQMYELMKQMKSCIQVLILKLPIFNYLNSVICMEKYQRLPYNI